MTGVWGPYGAKHLWELGLATEPWPFVAPIFHVPSALTRAMFMLLCGASSVGSVCHKVGAPLRHRDTPPAPCVRDRTCSTSPSAVHTMASRASLDRLRIMAQGLRGEADADPCAALAGDSRHDGQRTPIVLLCPRRVNSRVSYYR